MTSPKRKIAIFSALFAPSVGGVEKYTESLTRALALRGNEVTVVTSRIDSSPLREEIGERVRVVRLPSLSLLGGRLPLPRRSGCFATLMEELESWGVDYVIVNTRFYGLSIAGLDFAKRMGVTPVLIEHGSAYITLGNDAIDKILHAYERWMTWRVKRFVPKFYGVSAKSCEWLGHFGVEASGVLSNAIDAQSFRELSSGRDFRHECGVPGDAMLVAFVGRLIPEKGLSLLLEAARLLVGDPSIVFVVAGGGPEREALEQAGLPNVVLVGGLDPRDVSALLSQSDVFLLPSRSEGFATSLLESAAWGVPSLVTDVGGARELEGPDASFLIMDKASPERIADGLRWAKNHRAEAVSAGASALARVEDCYSWEETARLAELACERANGREGKGA